MGNPLPCSEGPRSPFTQSIPPKPHVGEVLGPLMVIVSMVLWKYACPILCTRSESFLKASQWLYLRRIARDLLSFCLWWGCSSGETSRLATSSFSGLEAVASWLDDWCHHLVLVGGANILDIVGGEAVNGSSPPTVASCGVVASMAASGTLPVRSSSRYISTQ